MQMTGAEVMVKCLAEQGVTTVFGYPGGAILPFYDALREAADIRHILTAHEQGAAHAADGYARAGGQVGVCIATSGPGATNLVTGLANAFLDSIPVVAITGQVPVAMIGRDAFQEVDITGITMPITKHNFLVKRPEHLAQTIRLCRAMCRQLCLIMSRASWNRWRKSCRKKNRSLPQWRQSMLRSARSCL